MDTNRHRGPRTDPSRSARSIAYHQSLACGWNRRYERGGFGRRARLIVGELLPRIGCRGAWIDVGCGAGFFSRQLAERGAEVLGIDGSPAMIAAARAAVPRALEHSLRYEVMTIEDLDVGQARFDGAICLSVLEYVDRPATAVANMVALLKPGGTLLFSAPNRSSLLRRLQSLLRRLGGALGVELFAYLESSRQSWSRRSVEALAAGHGLRVEAVFAFDPVLPKPLWRHLSPSLYFLICRKADEARNV